MYHGTFHDYVVLTSQQTIMNFSIVFYYVRFLGSAAGYPCEKNMQIIVPHNIYKNRGKLFSDTFKRGAIMKNLFANKIFVFSVSKTFRQ